MNTVDRQNSKIFEKLISFLIVFAIVWQGGYFPTQYVAIFGFLCFVTITTVFRRQEFFKPNRNLLIMIILLILSYIGSTIFISAHKYVSIIETVKLLCFLAFFVAVTQMRDTHVALKAILNGCLLVSVIGLTSYADLFSYPQAVLNDGISVRLQSTIQYANVTALFLGIGFFISYYFVMEHRQYKSRLKYYTLSFVCLIALFLTLSRGTTIIFIFMLVIWLILGRSSRKAAGVLLGFALSIPATYIIQRFAVGKNYLVVTVVLLISIGLALLIFYLAEEFKKAGRKHLAVFGVILSLLIILSMIVNTDNMTRVLGFSMTGGTFIERVIHVQDGLDAVKSSPLLGIGPGNWNSMQFSYQSAQYSVRYIHNGFMQVAVDSGVPALGLFLGVLVLFYINILRRLKASRDHFLVTNLITVTFVLLHSFLDVGLSFSSVLIVTACLLAVSFKDETTFTLEKQKKMLTAGVMWVFVLGSVFLFAGLVISYFADNHLEKGEVHLAKRLYEVNRIFKPLDGDVYLGLARCYQIEKKRPSLIKEQLEKAISLNQYEPLYYKELFKVANMSKEYEQAFETAKKLIYIEPLNSDNYIAALDSLDKMNENHIISTTQYISSVKEITQLAGNANQKRSHYAKYLRKQRDILIPEKYLKMIK